MFVTNHKTYFACADRLHEVERRHFPNRLYDEERRPSWQNLRYAVKPLADITDSKELDAKVKGLTIPLLKQASVTLLTDSMV